MVGREAYTMVGREGIPRLFPVLEKRVKPRLFPVLEKRVKHEAQRASFSPYEEAWSQTVPED